MLLGRDLSCCLDLLLNYYAAAILVINNIYNADRIVLVDR